MLVHSNGTASTFVKDDTSLRALLSPLRTYLVEKEVTEVCVNRPLEVWCERNSRWEVFEEKRITLSWLRSFSTAAASFAKQNLCEASPLLSSELPDGERLQVVIPPACEAGTVSLTIRKPSTMSRQVSDYEKEGFFAHVYPRSRELSKEEEELLLLHQNGEYASFLSRAILLQKTIIVSGETGSGKTTLLKALLSEIPASERIITIEDVPELSLAKHPNHVHLFYPSEAKEEENAPVTAASLLRSCLRMKPSRILLGELRGSEAFDFLNIASSGHGGTLTSCHAGSCALTFERLALMVLQNRQGRELPYDVIKHLLYQTIDIVVHVHNEPGSIGRHITEIWYAPDKKREGI